MPDHNSRHIMEPLVTIVIPAYNVAASISEALDSVFVQTYRPIEIVVVDDGSTDKTAEIIKNYQSGLISKDIAANKMRGTSLTYLCQENSGPSKARNTGIRASRGEYIAFLDADDAWVGDKLEKQMLLFNKETTLDVVFSNVRVTKRKNGLLETFELFERQGLDNTFFGHEYSVINPLEKLLKINFMLTPAVVARKACFTDSLMFNEGRRHAEDWELWLRMALVYNFGYIGDVCVHVIDEGDGLCAESDQMVISRVDVVESFLKENNPLVSALIARKDLSVYLKEIYKWTGYFFMRRNNPRLALTFYGKALKEVFEIKTLMYYFYSLLISFYPSAR